MVLIITRPFISFLKFNLDLCFEIKRVIVGFAMGNFKTVKNSLPWF